MREPDSPSLTYDQRKENRKADQGKKRWGGVKGYCPPRISFLAVGERGGVERGTSFYHEPTRPRENGGVKKGNRPKRFTYGKRKKKKMGGPEKSGWVNTPGKKRGKKITPR